MLSTKIEDHKDIGLNADWVISTYLLEGTDDKGYFIFDDENGEFSLCHIVGCPSYEKSITTIYTGSFEDCIGYYNMISGFGRKANRFLLLRPVTIT